MEHNVGIYPAMTTKIVSIALLQEKSSDYKT